MSKPMLHDGTSATMVEIDDLVEDAQAKLSSIATTGEAHMDDMLAEAERQLRAIRQRIKRIAQEER